MKYIIDDKEYEVVIVKKNNKNTYIRVKEDMRIYISTNYFTTKGQIKRLLDRNREYLSKVIMNVERKKEKQELFYYLGNKYDIIIMPGSDVTIIDNNIYVDSMEKLEKWYKKEANKLFRERLDDIYPRFVEKIPYPKIKIRKMKTRWGVCNRRDMSITLNLDLMKYDVTKLDYVIVHELSHFVHFDHSNLFWNVVQKYCPRYKQIKKELKEE